MSHQHVRHFERGQRHGFGGNVEIEVVACDEGIDHVEVVGSDAVHYGDVT